MRERITFFKPNNVEIDGGGFETTWEAMFTEWCKVETVRSNTDITDSQFMFHNTLKFTIRFQFQVRPNWIIRYKAKDYTIRELINDEERSRYTIIIATTNDKPAFVIT